VSVVVHVVSNWTFCRQVISLTRDSLTACQMNALVNAVAILSSCQRNVLSAIVLSVNYIVSESSCWLIFLSTHCHQQTGCQQTGLSRKPCCLSASACLVKFIIWSWC